jgi:hypothetical protein
VKPIIITLSLLISACSYDGWRDVPGATLRPISEVSTMPQTDWAGFVVDAATIWNEALATVPGCPVPFNVEMAAEGGHPVRYISRHLWPHGNATGMTRTDAWGQGPAFVDIVADDEWNHDFDLTLLHELGHGIGLGHARLDLGPSIMIGAPGAQIYPRDIVAAACALGCGPCDGEDGYDE